MGYTISIYFSDAEAKELEKLKRPDEKTFVPGLKRLLREKGIIGKKD